MRTLPLALAAVAAAAPAFFAPVAHGDVVTSYWVGTGTFEVRVSHMPDLDQRRSGLSNSGSNHCVPTSTMNLFAYAANHGYSWVDPGSGNWQSNTLHSAGTAAILQMGQFMNTSGTNGTNGTGTWSGLVSWSLVHSGNQICAIRRSKSSSYTPTVAKMAQLAAQGWMMSFAYGRYDVVGSVGSTPWVSRDGGHAVTMTWTRRNSSEYFLRYRDPSNSSSISTQSTFENKVVYPVALQVYFGGADFRTMNAIAYPSSDGKIRIIDSYWGIRPNYGYRFTNPSSLQGATGGSLQLMDPTPFAGSVNNALPSINFSNFVTIEDIAFHPEMADALVLSRSIFVGQPTLLRRVDLLTGGLTTMPDAPENIKQICPSREGFIYGFEEGGKVYKLNGETGGIEVANSSTPFPAAICFDDTSDTMRLLSITERRIASYDKNLSQVQNLIVPTSIPMSGDGSVRVDPTTGRSWFKTDASALLYNYVPGIAGGSGISTITLPTLPGGLRNFQFGDGGELYIMGESIMKVLRRSATSGNWFEDTASPFNNTPGGSRMMMFTSSTNDDPAVHDTPEWDNIPTPELLDIGDVRPDCDADFTGDDIVNGADLGFMLSRWGSADGIADLNQDGIVNGADLGMLLTEWGNCL